jgi:hypothetical protein
VQAGPGRNHRIEQGRKHTVDVALFENREDCSVIIAPSSTKQVSEFMVMRVSGCL